eukprot:6050914-Prymnesium_polylepis.1
MVSRPKNRFPPITTFPYNFSGKSFQVRLGAKKSEYSRSFNFAQRRCCPRGLHTAREAVADARCSQKTAGSCARPSGLAQARREC